MTTHKKKPVGGQPTGLSKCDNDNPDFRAAHRAHADMRGAA